MFCLFENYLSSKDRDVQTVDNVDDVVECQHVYFENNDGTFCNRCRQQMTCQNTNQDQIQQKANIGIRKEMEFLNLSPEIVEMTNKYFIMACNQRIHRGNYRKAIICASLFHVLMLKKCPQSYDTVIRWFGLTNHFANKGFNLVKLKIPELCYLRESYSDTADMIFKHIGLERDETFLKFINRPDIMAFIRTKINRRMYMIVAAFVFIYIRRQYNPSIVLGDFCTKLQLSSTVVERILKSIPQEIHF